MPPRRKPLPQAPDPSEDTDLLKQALAWHNAHLPARAVVANPFARYYSLARTLHTQQGWSLLRIATFLQSTQSHLKDTKVPTILQSIRRHLQRTSKPKQKPVTRGQ